MDDDGPDAKIDRPCGYRWRSALPHRNTKWHAASARRGTVGTPLPLHRPEFGVKSAGHNGSSVPPQRALNYAHQLPTEVIATDIGAKTAKKLRQLEDALILCISLFESSCCDVLEGDA